MYLNDAFDVRFDRSFRPERPIPSGAISLGWVRFLGWFQLVASDQLEPAEETHPTQRNGPRWNRPLRAKRTIKAHVEGIVEIHATRGWHVSQRCLRRAL